MVELYKNNQFDTNQGVFQIQIKNADDPIFRWKGDRHLSSWDLENKILYLRDDNWGFSKLAIIKNFIKAINENRVIPIDK